MNCMHLPAGECGAVRGPVKETLQCSQCRLNLRGANCPEGMLPLFSSSVGSQGEDGAWSTHLAEHRWLQIACYAHLLVSSNWPPSHLLHIVNCVEMAIEVHCSGHSYTSQQSTEGHTFEGTGYNCFLKIKPKSWKYLSLWFFTEQHFSKFQHLLFIS